MHPIGKWNWSALFAFFLFLLAVTLGELASRAPAKPEFPVAKYVDPAQLEVPWPKHSHYKQPWRAFLETVPGVDFLDGLGLGYNVEGNHAVLVRLCREAGFKTFRIEVGWGNVKWDETGLEDHVAFRLASLLQACKKYNIRPLILLNAHHGVPCPVKWLQKELAMDAPKGSREIQFKEVKDIVPGRTGLSQLTDYWAAEVLITKLDEATGICQLSKPLPKNLKAQEKVTLNTLKYLPLYEVGMPEYEETASGWVKYAKIICEFLKSQGIEEFELEIWNELTFGSNFIFGINWYYKANPWDEKEPGLIEVKKDFLNPGGRAHELARRTIEMVKRDYPQVKCIWGFSNTTFYHCPIERLPSGTDGQSYHPYGTGFRYFPKDEYAKDQPWRNLEGYVPTYRQAMPEGWAGTFIQTESLMRLLNPEARKKNKPEGIKVFRHYITEHGVVPGECGIKEPEKGWDLKAKMVLRSTLFWLNKGISAIYIFCAYDENELGMGIMPVNAPKLTEEAKFDAVATLPMKVLRNLVKTFSGSVPLKEVRQLDVEVVSLGEQRKIFEGDGTPQHPPLYHREVFAFLPFQVTPNRFLIALYVMTHDITEPIIRPEEYRLTIHNIKGKRAKVSLYDPLKDRQVPLNILRTTDKSLTIQVPVVDYPYLLSIHES